jgi:hypothetical protein
MPVEKDAITEADFDRRFQSGQNLMPRTHKLSLVS